MSRVADPTTRISLLRAAEEVFAKKGLEAAKVEDIAKRAGCSKGAFYLHFEGKEEAFLQVVESFLARCDGMVAEPADLPDSAEALMELGLEQDVQLFEFLWQNRDLLSILHTCQGQYAYLFEAFHRELRGKVRRWIVALVDRGLYRKDLDVELVATLTVGAFDALANAMLQSEKKPPLREWLVAARRVFSIGLAADPSRWEDQRVSQILLPDVDVPEPLPSEPTPKARPPRRRSAK